MKWIKIVLGGDTYTHKTKPLYMNTCLRTLSNVINLQLVSLFLSAVIIETILSLISNHIVINLIQFRTIEQAL